MAKNTIDKNPITYSPVTGHRFAKRIQHNAWSVVAYQLQKTDLLRDKKANASSFIEKELAYNCIYFLIGYEINNDCNKEMMYVGQAGIRDNGQSVLDRLNEHAYLGNDPAKYIDKWTDIIVVTNEKGSWGATELDALEHIFWSLIPVGNRYNSQKPSCTGAELSLYTEEVKQIKAYLDFLEYETLKNYSDSKDIKSDIQNSIDSAVKTIAEAKSDLPIDLDNGTTSIPNITTPKRIINSMLDLLPESVWNDETVFFDPACKDGGYLLGIYERLMRNEKLLKKYGNAIKLSNHILSEQLYGIALNQNSRAITVDNLGGLGYNIRVIPNYVNILKYFRTLRKTKQKVNIIQLEKDLLKKEFGKEMKIDVVIGNPPYQGADGKSSIYPEFVENAVDIADTVCMVTRDNWLTGMAFEDMRSHLLESGGVVKIYHYPVVGELFTNVGVAVAYFLWQRGYTGESLYKRVENKGVMSQRNVNINRIIVSDIAASIVDKTISNVDWASLYNSRSYPFMDQRKRYALEESDERTEYYNVAVMANNEKTVFTSLNNFQNEAEVKKYKVLCGVIINEASLSKAGNVLTNIKAIAPMQVASETWSLVATFDNETETVNCKKYVQTKFFRFLANQTVNNRSNVTKNTFKYTPVQDFTSNSDIDWSQSISEIDKQLYQKYNLSDEEIAYIEKTIKSMDTAVIKSASKPKLTREDVEANYIQSLIASES